MTVSTVIAVRVTELGVRPGEQYIYFSPISYLINQNSEINICILFLKTQYFHDQGEQTLFQSIISGLSDNWLP